LASVVGLARRKITTFRHMSASERRGWLAFRMSIAVRTLRAVLAAPIYGLPAVVLALAGVRFLPVPGGWRAFGDLIDLPAQYVRAIDVGVIPGRTIILLSPPGSVANAALAREWSSKIKVVDGRIGTILLLPFTWLPVIGYGLSHWQHWRATGKDGQILRGGKAHLRSEALYVEKRGSLKILDLSGHLERAGDEVMRQFGLEEEDWWITLHVREGSYHQDTNNVHRNADIASYFPAAAAIVERGGWVVRIGDPSMKPLPPMDRVVDYVHTDVFSGWMDLYLAAKCHFMLGMSTGPCTLPVLYGRPMVCTNLIPLGRLAGTKNTMVIPKLAWLEREGRFMSSSDLIASSLGVAFYGDMFEKQCVTVVDNTPHEITAVTLEMLGRLDGSIQYSDMDNVRQRRFEELWSPEIPPELWRSRNRLGREFAREHPFVLQ
jgi:putative glycosyltransferase (TIGR04372 family)